MYVIFIIINLIVSVIFYVKFVNVELKEEVLLECLLVVMCGEFGRLDMYVDFLEVLLVDLFGVIILLYENVGDIDILCFLLLFSVSGG